MKEALTSMFDFKYSCVVCVDDHKFDLFKQTFNHYGLPIPMRIGELVEGQTPVQNCTHNHIQCVKYAKEHDWPYVLIFEDDAFPRVDIKERLEELSPQFHQLDFKDNIDLLYLGWYKCSGTPTSSPHFNKSKYHYTSHAYIVFRKFYDRFITVAGKLIEITKPIKGRDIGIDHIYKYSENSYYYTTRLFEQYTYPNTGKIHATSLVQDSDHGFPLKYRAKWEAERDMKWFDDEWMYDTKESVK